MQDKKIRQRIGIVGIPPLTVIRKLEQQGVVIFDLDEPQVKKDIELASNYLPRVYCAILRTVVINAISLELDAIYIDVGPGKCDCAQHTATVLEDNCRGTKIIRIRNRDRENFGIPLCRADMALMDKMTAITSSVQCSSPLLPIAACSPTAGFWGVPPRDFSLLSVFPNTTHIYGWSRCMENKTPDNAELEKHFNPEIPTVFFAQSFCAKTALARHLAKMHPHSLYLDCDVSAGNSAMAKIEAFLELSGC